MNIIFSIDYEIFGDGSGSMNACMLKPLNQMLTLTSKYNALLSIFAETMEIEALHNLAHYKAEAESVCLQLQEAVKNGHDVQLHLHPQWQQAVYQSDQQSYSLKPEKWRIGNLAKEETEQLIHHGKRWLEQLLRPVASDYQCIAFRAGGWCIQPSQAIIESLQYSGISIDSTVAPGAKNVAKADWYDFSKAPQQNAYWKVDKDVLLPASEGIYELPIATARIGLFRHLSIILNNMYHDSLAPECTGSYSIPGVNESRLLSKFRKLSNLGHVMLDISTMPADTLISITESWQQQHHESPDVTAVAIGHTKNFSERAAVEFEKYLQWAEQQGHQFITYQQWLKNHTH